jgi:hypothetical protein
MARGLLTISGWVYKTGTGDVHIQEDGGSDFAPVGAASAPPTILENSK